MVVQVWVDDYSMALQVVKVAGSCKPRDLTAFFGELVNGLPFAPETFVPQFPPLQRWELRTQLSLGVAVGGGGAPGIVPSLTV